MVSSFTEEKHSLSRDELCKILHIPRHIFYELNIECGLFSICQ